MTTFTTHTFPRTRIATLDVFGAGKRKHHVVALLEIDVTLGLEKVREQGDLVSFTAWIIKVISLTLKKHDLVAGYLLGKRQVVIFEDINVSLIIEKELDGQRIPVPLVIEQADTRSTAELTRQIREAKTRPFTAKDIVLQKRSGRLARLYYLLPGFVRRFFWRYLLAHPHLAFSKMGNVAVTSIGMMGSANGWFIPASVHPVCFGISTVVKKPLVVDDQIVIRDVLNMTILLDHDVLDGAPMARFVSDLSEKINNGVGL
ncbi:MAG: 2-oxo acid dehydrogenase subunit E2 [Saprospiraceae bacterium]